METWWNVFVSWVPFILLLVFWFYFMKKMRTSRQGQLIDPASSIWSASRSCSSGSPTPSSSSRGRD